MNTLIWHAHQWARRLGRTGLAGLLMLLVATGIQFGHTQPLHDETRTLEARIATQQIAVQRAALRPVVVAFPGGFVDNLPDTSVASGVIGQLEQLAHVHGVKLLRGQYAQSPVSGTSLLRWQVSLPVKAEYPKIIAFAATSLQALPSLSLDEFKFKRDSIETATLDADLRFSLYLREAAR